MFTFPVGFGTAAVLESQLQRKPIRVMVPGNRINVSGASRQGSRKGGGQDGGWGLGTGNN